MSIRIALSHLYLRTHTDTHTRSPTPIPKHTYTHNVRVVHLSRARPQTQAHKNCFSLNLFLEYIILCSRVTIFYNQNGICETLRHFQSLLRGSNKFEWDSDASKATTIFHFCCSILKLREVSKNFEESETCRSNLKTRKK